MSGRKSNLQSFKVIPSGTSLGASVTSSVTNILLLDNLGYQFNILTGSNAVGVLAIEVSIDYSQDNNGNVLNSGNWIALPGATQNISASTPSTVYFDLTQMSAPWVRLKYTRTSGTGTCEAYVTGKMI